MVVVVSKIRRGRLRAVHLTDRNGAFKNLQADIRPFADRFKVDPSLDEYLCQISPSCTKRVGADRYWSRHFISLEELDSLVKNPGHLDAGTRDA
jgi:hypothetical protein